MYTRRYVPELDYYRRKLAEDAAAPETKEKPTPEPEAEPTPEVIPEPELKKEVVKAGVPVIAAAAASDYITSLIRGASEFVSGKDAFDKPQGKAGALTASTASWNK